MTRPAIFAVMVVAAGSAGASAVVRMDAEAWEEQAALPEALQQNRAVALPRAILSIGGQDRRGLLLRSVYRSVLSSKGVCGSWSKEAPLPAGLSGHGASVAGGRVWITGGIRAGRQSGGATEEVWSAETGDDGRIRSWKPAGRLPEPLQGHAQAVVGNRLYVIGGMASGAHRSTVWMAEAGGTLGSWVQVTPLPVPVVHAVAVVSGDFIVVIGGQSPGSGKTLVLSTAYVGPVNADGTVHTWYLGSSRLPGPWLGFGRSQAAAVAWHQSIFCFGGQDPLWFFIDNIAGAAFDPVKGEMGTWGVAPGPAGMHQLSAAVAWKDWAYLVGGVVRGEVTASVLRGRFKVDGDGGE